MMPSKTLVFALVIISCSRKTYLVLSASSKGTNVGAFKSTNLAESLTTHRVDASMPPEDSPLPSFSSIHGKEMQVEKQSQSCRVRTQKASLSFLPRGGQLVASSARKLSATTKATKPATKSLVVVNEDVNTDIVVSRTPKARRIVALIRILFLTFYGSLGAIMPYLPVYYHSLGHDGIYIGMLGAVKPFTTFLVAPLWGILSDKTGKHHTILQYTFVSSLLLQLCLFLRREVWFLVVAGFLGALVNAPVKSLLDSMVMSALPAEDKTNYGKMRLWGQVGFGLGSSGVGMLLSHTCNPDHNANLPRFLKGYGVAFFFHGLLAIPTLFCMKVFERTNTKAVEVTAAKKQTDSDKQEKQQHGAQIWQGLSLLVRSADAFLFFFLVLVVGISSGIIENFAYVRMREVGGTGKDMGISRLVSSGAGVPMFWFSGPLTAKLGADKILVMAILSYVTRFFIYAFMPSPIYGLPAEALRGVTFAAFWSTSTIYAHRISPPGMSATMLMFLNAMYGGLGQSLGALIGGKMQSHFGTVKTFIYSGLFDLHFAVVVAAYLFSRGGKSSFRSPKALGTSADTKEKLK